MRYKKFMVYAIWLIGVILWNFGFPEARPIEDVLMAIVLSFLSIGLKKSYFDNRFLIGLSLENYNDVIKYHSNVSDSLPLIKKISTSYSPKFLPLDIIIDYLYQDTNNSELAIGIHGNIYKNFYLYSGKHIYLNNIDYYGFFNNLACGLGILINNRKKINNAFRIDLGVQHLTDGVLNIGTSFTIITLDNF